METGQAQSPVTETMGRIEKQLIRGEELLNALEGRLARVLKPGNPAPAGVAAEARQEQSEMRVRLSQYAEAIMGHNCHMQYLLDRLDL